MKIIILIVIITSLISCVSKQREQELINKVSELESQLDDCKNGDEKLHAKMKLTFDQGDFQLCKVIYSEMENQYLSSDQALHA